MTDLELDQKKKRFAFEILKAPGESFSIAKSLLGDTPAAFDAAGSWIADPIVLEEKDRLIEAHGQRYFLPTREDMVRDILKRASFSDNDGYTKLMKLASEMLGYIEKPGTSVTTNVQMNPIMIVKDHGSDDDWENKVSNQQRSLLIEGGRG